MKLNGVKISGPNVETIIIPRGDGPPIVLKAAAILDAEEFERLCPLPKPPDKIIKGGNRVPNFEDSHYVAAIKDMSQKRVAYMVVKSLEATEGLEWETVKILDPATWLNYEKELQTAGFSNTEVNKIIEGVMTANCLNESKLEEARARFLQCQAEVSEA